MLQDIDHNSGMGVAGSETYVAARGQKNPADRPSIIVSALVAASVGALLYNILPLYLGSAGTSNALSNMQIGLLGTAFFFGFNLSGFSAFLWARRVHWRTASLAMVPIMLGFLFVSAQTSSYTILSVATALEGAAFGTLFTIGSLIVGDTTNPARWYGVKVAVESSLGVVLLLLLPWLVQPTYGFAGVAIGVGATILLLSPLMLRLPMAWDKAETTNAPVATRENGQLLRELAVVMPAILALMMSFAGGSAIWAFLEQIGSNSHYSPTGVGTILAASLIFGVGGSFSVAAIGNRFGTAIPFAVAALAVVVAFWCIQIPNSFGAYAVGSCVFMIGWSACVPLAMGEIANLDGDGRFVTLLVPALGVGSMIGPGVSGWLYEVGSLADVLIFAGLCTVVAAVLMIVSERIGRSVRRSPAIRG